MLMIAGSWVRKHCDVKFSESAGTICLPLFSHPAFLSSHTLGCPQTEALRLRQVVERRWEEEDREMGASQWGAGRQIKTTTPFSTQVVSLPRLLLAMIASWRPVETCAQLPARASWNSRTTETGAVREDDEYITMNLTMMSKIVMEIVMVMMTIWLWWWWWWWWCLRLRL